ncbi:MAG: cyclic nucleotide-binding domain-containing protein [bacterium]|nr:cyclic nucleotide-binding domain-containing protein [bacterium]
MLSWLQGKKDVNRLIARGQYAKAIKVIQKHLREDPKSVHLRKMLADVLERDGQKRRAIEVLEGLVQEFSTEGFVTKAIAVLKKIQRIDPGQSDAEEMLDTLIKIRGRDRPLREGRPAQRVDVRAPGEKPPSPPSGGGARRLMPKLRLRPKKAEPPLEADDSLATSVIMPSEFWFEEAAEGRDGFNWSPLFNDFSKTELMAMIGGLRLLVKKPGSIVYTEGEPGDSLFVLSSGSARVYHRDQTGHNDQVTVLHEGEVFGTPSVLFAKPRNRTIIALTECELLELDTATFEGVAQTHPRVAELVRELHDKRA